MTAAWRFPMFNRVRVFSLSSGPAGRGVLISVTLALLAAGCAGRQTVRPVTEPVPLAPTGPRVEPSSPPPLPEPEPIPDPEHSLGKEPPSRPSEVAPGGVYHTLGRGQTLFALSKSYGVPVAVLIEVNEIADPARIPAGAKIFIPGVAEVRAVSRSRSSSSSSHLAWPIKGRITSKFGLRGKRRAPHEGIDIDGRMGQLVRAAADGKVTKAGYGKGYGRMVVIDHGGGITTVYAHANKLLVKKGQRVRKGDSVCGVGMSGNARGTHLHFEVRKNGRAVNPMNYLSSGSAGKSTRR